MRFVSVEHGSTPSWGVVEQGTVRLLGELAAAQGRTLAEVLRDGDLDVVLGDQQQATTVNLSEVTLLPPTPDAQKIICVGLNYADHIAEMNRPTPEKPVIFSRFNDSFVGHDVPLEKTHLSDQFDFEGEFAVVIGRGGRHISAAQGLDHVFGYTIMNDGSFRDYQRHTHQFTPGKNFPRSGSLGPEIVTVDEFGPVGSQRIVTRLAGEVMQQSTLNQLVFGVADLVAYCSEWTTLAPGDIIATGTPGGVGDGQNPKRWMRPGETVEVEIDGIGVLRNRIIDESEHRQ